MAARAQRVVVVGGGFAGIACVRVSTAVTLM